MTESIKKFRHDLATSIGRLSRSDLLSSRDTAGDVGTEISTASEFDRHDVGDVIAAASSRVSQSLRVLEEYCKMLDPTISRDLESIRYRSYSVAAELEIAARNMANESHRHRRAAKLQSAMLYALIDCAHDAASFESGLRRLLATDIDIFQLRDKAACDRVLYDRARLASHLARQAGKLFIVNDRADIAIATDADGVHVGQDELPLDAARELMGDQRLVGVSTHDLDQVHEAISGGADYIGCGPVFSGTTKSFDDFPGPDFLRLVHQSTKETPRPAFAIGGIGLGNVDQVRETGFHRIAVTGAIRDAEDPGEVARKLKEILVLCQH